jgi:hypothetical protein
VVSSDAHAVLSPLAGGSAMVSTEVALRAALLPYLMGSL